MTIECDSEIYYDRKRHAARYTDSYLFHQLIPYIGNKRKLLPLIHQAIIAAGVERGDSFTDLFAGSGVVARFAKRINLRVTANDWEPYSLPINQCAITINNTPSFINIGGYENAISVLNGLPGVEGWVTENLCPRDDDNLNDESDRMFFMRKNGMRIDAMREMIAVWRADGTIDETEEAALLAPLLYSTCYVSNTSGVFKGFHRGWGGSTGVALYRIKSDIRLSPAVFYDNSLRNNAICGDAGQTAKNIAVDIAYIDPPYNQHPYGSNYHILNSVTLWDKPQIPANLDRGNKSAIRTDWRTLRRSAYNRAGDAIAAYSQLIINADARHIITSYSTDGLMKVQDMMEVNCARGAVQLFMQEYKRYRVSPTRTSKKPLNVEFVILTDTTKPTNTCPEKLTKQIFSYETNALAEHPENR
jgi:adenine-specific DNA-methyltransferase